MRLGAKIEFGGMGRRCCGGDVGDCGERKGIGVGM